MSSFCLCSSVVKQLCFDDRSPDENCQNSVTIEVRLFAKHEGETLV